MKAKIIRIGNSKGILIPKHILKKYNIEEGDSLYISEVENPPQIILRPAESEAEQIGLTKENRREIDKFLKIYGHLIRTLK